MRLVDRFRGAVAVLPRRLLVGAASAALDGVHADYTITALGELAGILGI